MSRTYWTMALPLRLLREWLPASPPTIEQQLENTARRLLDTLAGRSAADVALGLSNEAIPAIVQHNDLLRRFDLLEDARRKAEVALPVLETCVGAAALPLPGEATTAALHADNLMKALALGYHGIAAGLEKNAPNAALGQLFHRAILRAMTLLARRQQLAFRAYATPSASCWQLVHELYRMACTPKSVPLNGDTGPIEHLYLGALLFAYLNPHRLPRSEFNRVIECIRQLASYAVIATSPAESTVSRSAESCFLIRPDDSSPDQPLFRLTAETAVAEGLIIDCTPVLAAIDRNLRRPPGRQVQPDLKASPELLQSLRVAIGGKRVRRFSRTRFQPRADLIAGVGQVIDFIDGYTLRRRAFDAPGDAELAFQASEWSLIDESPDGFRIRFIKGEPWTSGAGDIVALQPRESSKIHVCLVRRVASANNRLELGLQLLSPQVSVIQLPQRNGHDTRAVFLHCLPAFGKLAGLITEPGAVAPGHQIEFKSAGQTLHREIGKRLEASSSLELFALTPISD